MVKAAEANTLGRHSFMKKEASEESPPRGVPAALMWTIMRAIVKPLPSYGFCASLDEAKAKFAETLAPMVGTQGAGARFLVTGGDDDVDVDVEPSVRLPTENQKGTNLITTNMRMTGSNKMIRIPLTRVMKELREHS